MEEKAIYTFNKPKNTLYNGVGYFTYILQYVNNPNVKFKQRLSDGTTLELDFTTDIFIQHVREQIDGDIGLFKFSPPFDSGLPYIIINAINNGQDVFKLINCSWAYERKHAIPTTEIYLGKTENEWDVTKKIEVSDENLFNYLTRKFFYK